MLLLAVVPVAWSQLPQPATGKATSKPPFAREWWLNSDAEERSGFLNGVADCLTWTAHKKGFNATPEQIMDKIDKFYKSHSGSASLNVIDVWRKVGNEPEADEAAEGQGETWKNAHWYLNGDWWMQAGEAEQLGFVEGYLWCLRTQVPATTESYSGSADSYRRRIDAFVRAHPKQGNEAVAVTLRRYRDHEDATAPK
ncbi:MAG: hypothetical protein ABSD44_09685 [Terracidiphilus sp.]